MATLTLDGLELDLRIADTERTSCFLNGATVELSWDDSGDLQFSDLRMDGAPYPPRGGTPDPFDRELAKRIHDALVRDYKRTPDFYDEHLRTSDGAHPSHSEGYDRLLPQELR